jgi:hypothetical protein
VLSDCYRTYSFWRFIYKRWNAFYIDFLLDAPACRSSGDSGSWRNAVDPMVSSAAIVAITAL